MNTRRQATRTELSESEVNPSNQTTRTVLSESEVNPSDQTTSTELSELTSNTGNQATGIDSRAPTMRNISNQETMAVQANLVKMKDVGMINMGKQTVIINQGDSESVREMMGNVENRLSQCMDDLKQTVTDQSKVIERQRKEIESQREVIKQFTEKDNNPRRKAMIEETKARIDHFTKDQFVPTKAFEDAKAKLLQHKIVIIKGNSGDGKTRTALELLSWIWKGGNSIDNKRNQRCNKRPIQLYNFNDWDNTVEPNINLCIFIDDVSTDLFYETEKRSVSLAALISGERMEDSNYLVITILNDIFKSMSSNTIFIEKNLIDTSADKYNIKEEKEQILDISLPKEVYFSDIDRSEIIKCAPNIGFPQCCKLYRDVPELQKQGVRFFRKPFHFMKTALSKLEYGRCAALLYLFLCGGEVLEKDLDPSNDKIDKTLLEEVFDVDLIEVKSIGQLSYKKKVQFIHKSLDCLSGSLVTKGKCLSWRKDGHYFRFSHDSVKDTVALLYNEATPMGFIQNCPLYYLYDIIQSRNTTNEIVIAHSNKFMYKRLLRELACKDSKNYWRTASLDVWDDSQFVLGFFRWLDDEETDNKDFYLKWTTKDDGYPGSYHSYYTNRGDMYFPSFIVYAAHTNSLCLLKKLLQRCPEDHPQLQCVLFGTVRAGHIGVFNMIIERGVIPTIRAKRSQSSHVIEDINVLHEACLFERVEMVKILATKYPFLVQETSRDNLSILHVVVQTGNCSLYDTVETFVFGDISRVERVQQLCKLVDCRNMTVLNWGCIWCHYGNKMVLHLLHKYPELARIRDRRNRHCLHRIAWKSKTDLFIQFDSYLKNYYKKKGISYDITTLVTCYGESVLDMAEKGEGADISKQALCSYLSQFWS